jgi:hypothetical protein
MFGRLRRQIGAIALFILVLVPGAYGMPDESASAGHCLAAPTSTAPEGTHWFYRLDLRSTLRCWYLRVLGQSEQSTVAQGRPTHASRPHTLHRRRPALVHGAAKPSTRISIPSKIGSPAVPRGYSAIKAQSAIIGTATTSDSLERSGREDARSSSSQETMVQNSDATQVGDDARVPQRTVRVMWPIPTSEVSTKVTEISAVAKNESVKASTPEADSPTTSDKNGPLQLPERSIEPIPTFEVSTEVTEISALAKSQSVKTADLEAGPPTTSDKESPLQPPERTIKPLSNTPLALVVFLSLGLPAASVLAWLVMTADGARREQIAQKHLELNATKNWKYNNKRQPDVLDDQRDHWIDKLLSDQILSAKTSLRSSANAFVEPVTLGPEAIEAALRQFALRRRVASGHIGRGAPLPGSKGEYEWPKLVPGKTARTKENYGLAIRGAFRIGLRGALRNHS